jgi:hypothetical protein
VVVLASRLGVIWQDPEYYLPVCTLGQIKRMILPECDSSDEEKTQVPVQAIAEAG